MDVARLGRLRVSDESGRLRPSVHEVLRAARDLPVVIATGHANRARNPPPGGRSAGAWTGPLLLTIPPTRCAALSLEDLASLADLARGLRRGDGAGPAARPPGPADVCDVARSHPRIIYSSDLGQPNQPNVADWLNISQCWFTEAGLTDVEGGQNDDVHAE